MPLLLLNEVMNVSADEIYKIIGEARLPGFESMYAEDVKPSAAVCAIAGALLGLRSAAGVVAVRVILDTTKSRAEEDIANYLELPVLASIPKNGGKKSGYGYGYGAERNGR